MNRIKVMIVDDSLSIRLLLKGILSEDPDIDVVATAADPVQAMQDLKTTFPDVITLDVEMPQMDGLTFLEKLMRLRPIPTVMISTLTQEGSDAALRALELGAIDVVAKPSQKGEDLRDYGEEIIAKIKAAACARAGKMQPRRTFTDPAAPKEKSVPAAFIDIKTYPADEILAKSNRHISGRPPIIAIGSSTGGPEALRVLFSGIPPTINAPIIISQHIGAGFTTSLAKRLSEQSGLRVQEATNKVKLQPGNVYLCPAGKHFTVSYSSGYYTGYLLDGHKVNRHKPSVDVMFRSVANEAGDSAIAALLTGMGDDGAKGLKEIYDQGGFTIAQDESSCIVYGMPKAAVSLNAAKKVLNLNNIAKTIEEEVKS